MDTSLKNYQFELEFDVRDYECDLQGIVNNAVYQNYLEHARHQYLLSKNIDFAGLHKEGIDLIVSRVEIDYKSSLYSADKFVVKINSHTEGYLRVVFEQEIYKLPANKLVVKAKVVGVGVKNGRPIRINDVPGFSEIT